MGIAPLQAAKRVCKSSGWSLSNLAINKILYIANLVYYRRNAEHLIDGNFEAWDYGPVLPSVYHRGKVFGSSPVQNVFHDVSDLNNETPEAKMLDEAVQRLSRFTPGELVSATHWKNGAWAKHYAPGVRSIVIPRCDIAEESEARFNGKR